jgi:hypothetical protein
MLSSRHWQCADAASTDHIEKQESTQATFLADTPNRRAVRMNQSAEGRADCLTKLGRRSARGDEALAARLNRAGSTAFAANTPTGRN